MHRWDTNRDEFLAAPYDRNNLAGKKTCKIALLDRFRPEAAPGPAPHRHDHPVL